MKGIVKAFFRERGFGFIFAESDPDLFVHYSAIQMVGYKELHEGDRVEFEIGKDRDGRKIATNVVITESLMHV